MNERSFIVKSDISTHFWFRDGRGSSLRTVGANSDKDATLHRKLRHSAQRDPLSCPTYLAAAFPQDFVSQTASTACETTGTGCAVEVNPAKGSGVGCPMNWKIAATTLKMHVA